MLIVDTECSGLKPERHSILSIGAVDFRNPDNRFYGECRVWDGAEIMEEALAVNGFTMEQATDPSKQSEAELIEAFLSWSQDLPERTLTGQNVAYDNGMLRAAAERAHANWNLAYRTVDVHTLCWMHIVKREGKPPVDAEHRRSALNSDAVLEYCALPHEPDPHNALTGALWHAEVTSRLLYDKKLLPEFEQYEIPWLV
ncbi:3'-5' exonuclease [Candidatus Kaiserbacteria bacterium]|nr:3'-5' exonuclease [Candidatus Kaiserbacteria bacterium]